MSLFRSSLRPPAILSDEAVERYVAALKSSLEPDPHFRRRLRGHVLNEYVAMREGIAPRRGTKEMGRLGRAVLYATFALAVSVGGAMAASQPSIPGDFFYPLKRQIEALRMQVLPAELHAELAAHDLGERIVELDRLATSGDWEAVALHAPAVEEAYAAVVALGADGDEVAHRLGVAAALVERLPDAARAVVSDALADLPGVGGGRSTDPPGRERDHGGVPPGHSGGGSSGRPEKSERPDATPKATPKAKPTATPSPRPTPPGRTDREPEPKSPPGREPAAASPRPQPRPPEHAGNPNPVPPRSPHRP